MNLHWYIFVNIKICWNYFWRPEHNNEVAFKHVTLIDSHRLNTSDGLHEPSWKIHTKPKDVDTWLGSDEKVPQINVQLTR